MVIGIVFFLVLMFSLDIYSAGKRPASYRVEFAYSTLFLIAGLILIIGNSSYVWGGAAIALAIIKFIAYYIKMKKSYSNENKT